MIFFDIDGTLFDQEKAEKLATIRFFKDNLTDLQVNQKEFATIREIYHNNFLKYLLKGVSALERNRMLMKDLFGHHISNEIADQKATDFVKLYKQNWIPFDDVIPCLEHLKSKHLNLGIICNGNYDRQVDKLESLGVKDYFDVITISSQKYFAKPNKHIFLAACNEANIKPEQAYYIGDNLVYDAIASKNAGMDEVWVNRKKRTTYYDLNVIHSLNELANIIE